MLIRPIIVINFTVISLSLFYKRNTTWFFVIGYSDVNTWDVNCSTFEKLKAHA